MTTSASAPPRSKHLFGWVSERFQERFPLVYDCADKCVQLTMVYFLYFVTEAVLFWGESQSLAGPLQSHPQAAAFISGLESTALCVTAVVFVVHVGISLLHLLLTELRLTFGIQLIPGGGHEHVGE